MTRVEELGSRQVREAGRFDGVHERAWFAGRGNEVIPSARRQLRGRVDLDDRLGNRVRAVEVVQEPPIQAILSKRGLNGLDIERHRLSIGHVVGPQMYHSEGSTSVGA